MCPVTIGCAGALLAQTQQHFSVTRSDECLGCKLSAFVTAVTQNTISTVATGTKVIGFVFFEIDFDGVFHGVS